MPSKRIESDTPEPTMGPQSPSGVSRPTIDPIGDLARVMDPQAFTPELSPGRNIDYWNTRAALAREHAHRAIVAGWKRPPRPLGTGSYWDRQSEEHVRYALHGAFTELATIEDILAAALGYSRSPGGPDDPNGGGWVTGDHTPLTLAMEAARKLQPRPPEPGDPAEPREAVGRLAHQVARQVAETHDMVMGIRNRWDHLSEFWQELFMTVGSTCWRQGSKVGDEAAALELVTVRDRCASLAALWGRCAGEPDTPELAEAMYRKHSETVAKLTRDISLRIIELQST